MDSSTQQTILVTGGAGFIGSHLCQYLLNQGHNVISLDNYFTGSKDTHVDGVAYIKGHTKDIAQYITEVPDMLYHLGEYSRVAKSLEEPGLVWDLNMEGTFAVLEFWRKHKCKLIYAGSSTKAVGPRADGVEGRNLSPYTWTKAANSDLVNNYGTWYHLPYVIVYFYNVYGPGERSLGEYGTVIESFKQKYLNNKPLEVRSPGTQTRAFTHIEDSIKGLVLAAEHGSGDGYGLSADNEIYSLLDVAHMFSDNIMMLPATKTTREMSEVDSEKITGLGWQPKHNLEEYIAGIKNQ